MHFPGGSVKPSDNLLGHRASGNKAARRKVEKWQVIVQVLSPRMCWHGVHGVFPDAISSMSGYGSNQEEIKTYPLGSSALRKRRLADMIVTALSVLQSIGSIEGPVRGI